MRKPDLVLIIALSLVLLWLLTRYTEKVSSTITFNTNPQFDPWYGPHTEGWNETLEYYGSL